MNLKGRIEKITAQHRALDAAIERELERLNLSEDEMAELLAEVSSKPERATYEPEKQS